MEVLIDRSKLIKEQRMKRVVIELPEGNDDVLSITAIGVNNNVSNMHVSTYIADLANGTHLIHDGKKWIQKKEEYVPDICVGNNGWILCSERLPEKEGCYIVSYDYGYTAPVFFIDGDWELLWWCSRRKPIAWQPFPEPYQKGE